MKQHQIQPWALPLLPLKKTLKVAAALDAALDAPIAPIKKKNLEALCAPIASIKTQKLKKTLKLDAALEVALGAPIAPTPLIPVLLLCVREVCK